MREYFCRQWKGNRPGQAGQWHEKARGGGFSAALCLHVLTLTALLTVMLTACGGDEPPWGYVWTDTQQFESLTWHVQNGQLSGQDSGLSYAQVSFPSAPQPQTYGAA